MTDRSDWQHDARKLLFEVLRQMLVCARCGGEQLAVADYLEQESGQRYDDLRAQSKEFFAMAERHGQLADEIADSHPARIYDQAIRRRERYYTKKAGI
jgi:hypothetical protein